MLLWTDERTRVFLKCQIIWYVSFYDLMLGVLYNLLGANILDESTIIDKIRYCTLNKYTRFLIKIAFGDASALFIP